MKTRKISGSVALVLVVAVLVAATHVVYAATVTVSPDNVNRMQEFDGTPWGWDDYRESVDGTTFSTRQSSGADQYTIMTTLQSTFLSELASALGTLGTGEYYLINSATLTVGSAADKYEQASIAHQMLTTYDAGDLTWNDSDKSEDTRWGGGGTIDELGGTDWASETLATGVVGTDVTTFDLTSYVQGVVGGTISGAGEGLFFENIGGSAGPDLWETATANVEWTLDAEIAEFTVTWDGDDSSGDQTWTNPDDNSWSGATYTNGYHAHFLGSGDGTVTISGTVEPASVLVSNAAVNYTFSGGTITGTGTTLTKDGAGTLTLSCTKSYTGATTVNSGILEVTTSGLPLNGAVVISNATMKLTGSGFNLINDNMVTIRNGGILTDDTTSGPGVHSVQAISFIDGGTLTAGDPSANATFGQFYLKGDISVSGNAAATISADAVGLNGTRTFTVAEVTGDAGTDLLVSSVVKYTGALTKAGAGTMTLSGSGANTFTGPVTVNNGTLVLQKSYNVDAIGSGVDIVVNTGATLKTLQGQNISDTVSSITIDGGTFDVLPGIALNEIFGGSVSMTNATISGCNDGSSFFWAKGGYEGDGNNTISRTIEIRNTDPSGQFDINSGTTTVSGIIKSNGEIVKNGAGTLTLSGANTYTGDTTVSNGVLQLAVGGSLVTAGTMRIASPGKLQLDVDQTVEYLWLDGVKQNAGDYGSTLSGATYPDNTYFAGTGILTVSKGPDGTLFKFR